MQFLVLCLKKVLLQEIHLLLAQMDLLKFDTNTLESVGECFHMLLLMTGVLKCTFLLIPTILNYCHLYIFHHMWKFRKRHTVFPWIFSWIFQESLFWKWHKLLFWLSTLITLLTHWFKTPVQKHTVETSLNWFLLIATTMLQLHSKVHQHALKNLISLAYAMQDTPNFA